MIDFEVQRCSRRCSATDRELKDGETCYSVLVSEGASVVRRDYSAEAWPGPPEKALGWWKSTVVDPNIGRLAWAPNDVMLNYFERLGEDPAAEDTRYVLALLLVRRRIARVERTEKDESGREVLIVYCPRNEGEYRVAEALPTPERAAAIQQQLSELLQMHGA
ncbi:MAG: hypothetical protein WD872_13710 [Pirellulaceae bacterium]